MARTVGQGEEEKTSKNSFYGFLFKEKINLLSSGENAVDDDVDDNNIDDDDDVDNNNDDGDDKDDDKVDTLRSKNRTFLVTFEV